MCFDSTDDMYLRNNWEDMSGAAMYMYVDPCSGPTCEQDKAKILEYQKKIGLTLFMTTNTIDFDNYESDMPVFEESRRIFEEMPYFKI